MLKARFGEHADFPKLNEVPRCEWTTACHRWYRMQIPETNNDIGMLVADSVESFWPRLGTATLRTLSFLSPRHMISQATQLLSEISGGDHATCDQLFELVYDDFRRIAQQYIGQVAPAKDLQATDVVHEVYLRLIDQSSASWKDRSHFFAMGAHIMRHVLVDDSRRRMAAKRGGKAHQITIELADNQIKVSPNSDADVLAVHEALEKLAKINEQRGRIVEMRFFAGLTVEESAVAIGISKSTAERQWRVARAWLRRELANKLS